ncbi:MAG: lysophospholipid acyltransferase family protein [Terriglobales bacterium]
MASERSKLADALSWVRSIFLFDPLIYLYTVALGPVSLLCSFFDKGGRLQHNFVRLWSRLILGTIFSSVTVTGLDHLDTSKPYLYASNHLSALDIPVIYAHLPLQFRVMAKIELFSLPFVGWHLRRSGQLPIERENALASMRSLNRSAETLKAGTPLLVFPEGGRSATGQVKPFLPGVFYAAIKAQAEVVPIALVGLYELLPMNTYHIRPRPLEMLVGEPISSAGYSTREAEKLAAQVQKAVEDLYYSRAEVPDPRAAPVMSS